MSQVRTISLYLTSIDYLSELVKDTFGCITDSLQWPVKVVRVPGNVHRMLVVRTVTYQSTNATDSLINSRSLGVSISVYM